MTGYVNPEEQQKAVKVRKLVEEARRLWKEEYAENTPMEKRHSIGEEGNRLYDEAEVLSNELAEYLKRNYPDNFKVHQKTLSEEAFEDFSGSWHGVSPELEEILEEYNNEIPIHDILIYRIQILFDILLYLTIMEFLYFVPIEDGDLEWEIIFMLLWKS
jgi:hypothetical protein